MLLSDIIYTLDKEMVIKFSETTSDIEHTLDTLPLDWLNRTIVFITRENDEDLDEEPLVIYTVNNEELKQ